jgi:hypothetical protein
MIRKDTHFQYQKTKPFGNSATRVVIHFLDSLAAFLLLTECTLQHRRALPENRKNAPQHASNYQI